MDHSQLALKRPWENPCWKPSAENKLTFKYLLLVHVLAVVGLFLFPIPTLTSLLWALGIIACGGLGVSLGYHRALAHRSVTLHPVVEQILIFFAVINGSGAPTTWTPNHRDHHKNADTVDDVSSPRHGGFWWAHIRWVYQWTPSDLETWAPDMNKPKYLWWRKAQPFLLGFSLCFGYFVSGWEGFFWIGPIRLVYILHMQMFVNSLLHLKPGLPDGADTSQNIWWLGPLQVTAWGENWHGNHHAYPASAKFSRSWWQVDVPWITICILEKCGLATKVRR